MTQPSPKIEMLPVASLRPYAGNARRHSRKQVRQIADSVRRFGFTNPVLISDEREIIAGHGRVRFQASMTRKSSAWTCVAGARALYVSTAGS